VVARRSPPDADHALKAENIAASQDIPLRFRLGILNELRRARLVTSQRGIQGGYSLARPPAEINRVDVIRAIDEPLASVHDESVATLRYPGPAEPLRDVWMAVRSSLRSVLERVSIADLVSANLPLTVRRQGEACQDAEAARGGPWRARIVSVRQGGACLQIDDGSRIPVSGKVPMKPAKGATG
jgi:Rrf2 family protein